MRINCHVFHPAKNLYIGKIIYKIRMHVLYFAKKKKKTRLYIQDLQIYDFRNIKRNRKKIKNAKLFRRLFKFMISIYCKKKKKHL